MTRHNIRFAALTARLHRDGFKTVATGAVVLEGHGVQVVAQYKKVGFRSSIVGFEAVAMNGSCRANCITSQRSVPQMYAIVQDVVSAARGEA